MELRQLRHLIALEEAGSYARAAEQLNISQPAITLSIAKLERELDAKLFERGHFGAVPTPLGVAMLKRARLACAELRLASLELEGLKGAKRGSVTIGVGALFAQRLVPAAIAEFNRRRPHVAITTLEGTSAQLFAHLSAGEIDMVMSCPLRGESNPMELSQEVLFSTQDVVMVRAEHPVARDGKPVTMRDLARYPWLISARCQEMQAQVMALFAAAGIEKLPTIVRTDGVPIIRQLLIEGDYVGVISSELEPFELGQTRLRVVPLEGLQLQRVAALTYRKRSALSPTAAAFVRVMRAKCRELIGHRLA